MELSVKTLNNWNQPSYCRQWFMGISIIWWIKWLRCVYWSRGLGDVVTFYAGVLTFVGAPVTFKRPWRNRWHSGWKICKFSMASIDSKCGEAPTQHYSKVQYFRRLVHPAASMTLYSTNKNVKFDLSHSIQLMMKRKNAPTLKYIIFFGAITPNSVFDEFASEKMLNLTTLTRFSVRWNVKIPQLENVNFLAPLHPTASSTSLPSQTVLWSDDWY